MKIVFYTLGTRGDVQPYIALAKQFIDSGHTATICTGKTFKNLIESNEVNYAYASLDLMDIMQTDIGNIMYNEPAKHPIKLIRFMKKELNPLYSKTFIDFFNAAQEADVLVYHPKALGIQDIALYYNIPCISMPLIPYSVEIAEFPNLFVSTNRNFGPTINKLSYKITNKVENNNIKDINKFRLTTLGMKKRKANVFNKKINDYQIPIVYPISKLLFGNYTSLNSKATVSEFLLLKDETKVSAETLDFLKKGKKPIVISFSSLPFNDNKKFLNNLETALHETNNRAILLTGTNKMKLDNPNIHVTDFEPHDKLFKLCKCIVHHGGAGSTGAALASGVPSIIIPFKLDQPFWAKQTYDIGYCLAVLKPKNLSKTDLVNAFKKIDNQIYVEKSKEAQNFIKEEIKSQTAMYKILEVVSNFNGY